MDVVETYRSPDGTQEVEIYLDKDTQDDLLNPLSEELRPSWFRFYTAANPRYVWGHEQLSTEELDEFAIVRQEAGDTVLPVYAYVHSGTAFSLDRSYPFDDPWDAGWCGVLIWNQESLAEHEIPADKVEEYAAASLKAYEAWVNGDVYGYASYKRDRVGGYLGPHEEAVKQIRHARDIDDTWLEVEQPQRMVGYGAGV